MPKSAIWFCFGVIATTAIVFAVPLFFEEPLKPAVQPQRAVAGNEPSSGDPDSLSEIAASRQPVSRTHKMAPIVDGPAYLTQKAEAELAKEQANSVEHPGMAGQPHDDGNGIVIDPDTIAATRAVLPNAVARGLSVVPGAIVCADLQTVSMMFHWYAEHWEDQAQDAMTNGQSRLIRSDTPAPVTPPGCALLPAGTPLEVKMVNGIPVVHAKLPDGSTIKGVTLGGMVSNH